MLARDGTVCPPQVAVEKVTVLSTERSLSECAAPNCFPVIAEMPASLKAVIWDDRKSAISGHRCVVGVALSLHLSIATGGPRFDV